MSTIKEIVSLANYFHELCQADPDVLSVCYYQFTIPEKSMEIHVDYPEVVDEVSDYPKLRAHDMNTIRYYAHIAPGLEVFCLMRINAAMEYTGMSFEEILEIFGRDLDVDDL